MDSFACPNCGRQVYVSDDAAAPAACTYCGHGLDAYVRRLRDERRWKSRFSKSGGDAAVTPVKRAFEKGMEETRKLFWD